jgi:hypothetical protein
MAKNRRFIGPLEKFRHRNENRSPTNLSLLMALNIGNFKNVSSIFKGMASIRQIGTFFQSDITFWLDCVATTLKSHGKRSSGYAI